MSPISSRKSVPPWACSKKPRLRAEAPVNAPRSCPKSSLSMSSRGMAAQFTLTNGRVVARREPVDGAADELLAGAALAGDEHARLGGRDLVDLVEEPLHRRALPDHLVAGLELLAQARPSRRDSFAVRSTFLHADEHALAVERLLEEVGRAELDGVDRVVHRRVPADDDDRQLAGGFVFAEALERLEAASCPGSFTSKMARSTGVFGFAQDLQRLFGALRFDDLVALAASTSWSVRRMFFSSSTTSTRGGVGGASAAAVLSGLHGP